MAASCSFSINLQERAAVLSIFMNVLPLPVMHWKFKEEKKKEVKGGFESRMEATNYYREGLRYKIHKIVWI